MFLFVSHLTVPEEDHDVLERHFREPAEIMARSRVRHETYDVLMDSREAPEWLGEGVRMTPGHQPGSDAGP